MLKAGKTVLPSGRLVVPEGLHGMRLDAALARLCPGSGVRTWRRMAAAGRILLGGRGCRPASLVRSGDVVSIDPDAEQALNPTGAQAALHGGSLDSGVRSSLHSSGPECGVRILSVTPDYCFFFKPALLHTVALAGSFAPSLEAFVPALAGVAGLDQEPILLQRLDYATSGIVAAARSSAAAAAFRALERVGKVSKRYCCLLEGELKTPLTIRNRLVSSGGRNVRALESEELDPVRWTRIYPLACQKAEDFGSFFVRGGNRLLTLAGCNIARGSRHQIRVHAAAAGYPLWGDPLYAHSDGAEAEVPSGVRSFFLHHGQLVFGSVSIGLPPNWNLEPSLGKSVWEWLSAGVPASDRPAPDIPPESYVGTL